MSIVKKSLIVLALTMMVMVAFNSTLFSIQDWCGCLNLDAIDAECASFCGAQQCNPQVPNWGGCNGTTCEWKVKFTCLDGTYQFKWFGFPCGQCGGEGGM